MSDALKVITLHITRENDKWLREEARRRTAEAERRITVSQVLNELIRDHLAEKPPEGE